MEHKFRTVLVTGATSGIGLELAKLFARDGFEMVIVARHQPDLLTTADELRELGAKEVTTIAKDLSRAGAAAEVYEETSKKNFRVEVLVNDAGVGEFGPFAETDLEKELNIIQLNIASLVQLTKLFLRDMLELGGGRILQLSSVAAYQPTPKLAVYAATKAFVHSFSDSLGEELKDTGVTVTALIPNATDTDFFRKAGMEHTRAAQEGPEDPAAVAKVGYEALMKGEPHAYGSGVKKEVAMSSVMSNRKIARRAKKSMQPADKKK
jgi:short-subunit dehydrogenase